MSIVDLSKPNRDTTLLAPFVQNRLLMALNECHDLEFPIGVFEGYRSPNRQDFLYAQGRTRAGKKVTYAKAYQSAHQWGLAVDLAFYKDKKWLWDGWPWERVHDIFHRYGFETLDFEKSHVEIMHGMSHKEAYKLYLSQGLIGLWDVISRRLEAKYDGFKAKGV